MVQRQQFEKKFNHPAGKMGQRGVFWFKEYVTSEWGCQRCAKRMPKGSVAFDFTSRAVWKVEHDGKTEWIEKPIKHFICLDCAKALLEETLDRVNIVASHGPNGLKLIEGI